ncbi:MAG: hypothetical protein HOI59_06985 [Nitrospina sp.]|jgi:hypothetical protein|nr:hypothetical protein [Nitrospina sp.]MBT3416127.1 hypothetical protein [Nitrospina sp.]MBT3857643.1 hypothetical protein [Nitrospina sp.]MBT4105718.1 hypothetical protein [Nitrospina sp.]MBT4388557.1 hypothetical protein [Nitrospina sp.]
MHKKTAEHIANIEPDLKEIKIKLSQLEVMLFNDFTDAHRTCQTTNPQLEIKYFEPGDLN